MSAREDLLALAERVEGATGPDRELDCLIAVAALDFFTLPPRYEGGPILYCRGDPFGNYTAPGNGGDMLVPDFTSSLDAAMTLVPDGCIEWHCGRHFKTGQGQAYLLDPATMREPIYCLAATPALALTAASLRALAASVGRNAERHDPEEGRGPKDEHAVPEGQTPTPSRSSTIARKG